MRIAILGDGAAESAWFDALRSREATEVFRTENPDAPADVLVLGGPVADRAEILRRAAADGPVIVCLHPPGPDDLAYLQASARVVPDLPSRLHPAIDRLRAAIGDGSIGEFRSIRYEVSAAVDDLMDVFSRGSDVLRALLGEFETLSASGDPEGPNPERELLVRLRARDGRPAELRVTREADAPAILTLAGTSGSLRFLHDPSWTTRARLERRPGDDPGEEFDWSPHRAMLEALGTAAAPSSEDGIRSMELTAAARRSLRLRRTVEVRPAPLTEEAAFKASMATAGCLLLLGTVVLLAFAGAARAMGFDSAAKAAWIVPFALAAFLAVAWAGSGRKPGEPEASETTTSNR